MKLTKKSLYFSILVVFLMIAGILVSPFAWRELRVHVGETTTLVSKEERVQYGLHTWPDGNIGVLKKGDLYHFYGTNGGKLSKVIGTLTDPLQDVVYTERTIQGLKETYNYAGGGPVYALGSALIMVYHAEYHPGGDFVNFYSTVGLAYSLDDGETFHDMGKILRSHQPFVEGMGIIAEMTGAPLVVRDGFMYVYFSDAITSWHTNSLAVARCSLEEIEASIETQETPSFIKFYNGSFSEPGLGGNSSAIEWLNPSIRWFDIAYDTDRQAYIIALIEDTIIGQNLFLMSSSDGFSWSPRINLTWRQGELFYPTLFSSTDDPKSGSAPWTIMYTYSDYGSWSRWDDARLECLTFSWK